MKKNVNLFVRIFAILTLVFAFSFATPFVAEVSAGEIIKNETIASWTEVIMNRTQAPVKAYGNSFTLSGGAEVKVTANITAAQESGYYSTPKIELVLEKDGVEIAPTSAGIWTLKEAGYYQFYVYFTAIENVPSGTAPFRAKPQGTFKVETMGYPKYKTFNVNQNGLEKDSNSYDLTCKATDYSGESDGGALYFYKDHYTNKMICLGASGAGGSFSATKGKTYTLYAVPKRQCTYTTGALYSFNLPDMLGVEVKLTAAQAKVFEEVATSKTVSSEPPKVATISGFKNAEDIIRANVTWNVTPKKTINEDPNLSYYKITASYKGQKGNVTDSYSLKKQTDGANNFVYTNGGAFYIPYEGNTTVVITPYFEWLGKTYAGTPLTGTVKSAKLTAPKATAVKITSKIADIEVYKPSTTVTGIGIFKKKGSKWVMIGSKRKQKDYEKRYRITAKGAGTTKYKAKAYLVDQGKTYWSGLSAKTYKPGKNQHSVGWSNRIGSYKWLERTVGCEKIYYSGSKLKVKMKIVNRTSGFKSMKFKMSVYCKNTNGKNVRIATGTCKVGKLGYEKMKSVTVTLKAKKNYNLYHGEPYVVTHSYSVK